MKGKAAFVLGAGVGYLFGTKAGRQRFEQIKSWANQTWNDPKVQAKVSDIEAAAARVAKEQGGAVADKVRSAVGGGKGEQPGEGTQGTQGTPPAAV